MTFSKKGKVKGFGLTWEEALSPDQGGGPLYFYRGKNPIWKRAEIGNVERSRKKTHARLRGKERQHEKRNDGNHSSVKVKPRGSLPKKNGH